MKKFIKWVVIGIVAVFLLSFLFGKGASNESFEIEREWVGLSEEAETEIFYRFLEVHSETGFDPLPEIGQKERLTPKRDEAIRAVADEYNISTEQAREVIEKVQKRRPTDEELEIYETYDKQLNEAIDLEVAGKKLIDEDSIRQKVADSFDISSDKLSDIWLRVSVWKEENEIGAENGEALAENIKSVKENEKQDASQDNINLKISQESFDIYYKAFLRLSELQEDYEDEYAKSDKNGLYGSISREIISIRDSLPKPNFDMSPEERNLLTDINQYSMDLYFLDPQEDELEGIGVTSDRRKIVEDALDEIKKTNGF